MSHAGPQPPEAGLAARLEAEAALVAASLAAGCAWAAAGLVRLAGPAAAGERPGIVLPTAHLTRLGGAPLAALLRLGGAHPVPVGTVRDCPEEELREALGAAAAGLLVVDAGLTEVVAPARFLWLCREAGRPALVLDPASGRWPAWADGGAALVLSDGAALAGVASGILAGAAAAIAACRAVPAAAAFAAPAAVLEAIARRSVAGEPAQCQGA
jgi:seryl-tRNA(Sec) selenium transferase